MGRRLEAYISQKAIRHNLKRIKELAPEQKIMAMVKANGYGHGLVHVAEALNEADALGVACIEEALILRQNGIATEIVLMEGFFHVDELDDILTHNLTVVIHAPHQLEAICHFHSTAPINLWVKFNSGMNRLGLPLSQADSIYNRLKALPHVHIIGWMGHFPQADDKQNGVTLEQYEKFVQSTKDLPGDKTIANSAAILGWPMSYCDWVRPGLALYGASPFPNSKGSDFGLLPAMELKSNLIATQELKPNDKVGYGGVWTCETPTRIGIIAAGYGDGYPWHAKNKTPVLIHDKITPLVGRVSMDMIAVDLGGCPEAKVGDEVTLWGGQLPVEVVASYANTIPYELFCRLTERVHIHRLKD